MDTFNRVTGHQEIGESAPSRPANFPEPPPIPETEHQLSHRASRASLPLNRQRSYRSIRSTMAPRASPPALPRVDLARQASPKAPKTTSNGDPATLVFHTRTHIAAPTARKQNTRE
jgi:hypothetical protein